MSLAGRRAWLLAAGRGERAGGPKAWRLHEGQPLLERQLAFLRGLFPADRIAIAIQPGWEERCRALDPGVLWVAERPEGTPLAALQALIETSPADGWAFLHHVDMPVWEPELFRFLAGRIPEAEENDFDALAPTCAGRRGHPVLLSPRLARDLLALDPVSDRLDLYLRRRREHVVPVPYGCVLENWNV